MYPYCQYIWVVSEEIENLTILSPKKGNDGVKWGFCRISCELSTLTFPVGSLELETYLIIEAGEFPLIFNFQLTRPHEKGLSHEIIVIQSYHFFNCCGMEIRFSSSYIYILCREILQLWMKKFTSIIIVINVPVYSRARQKTHLILIQLMCFILM